MIVGGVGGESGFHRQRPNHLANVVESRALDDSKARMPGRQSAKQGDKSRTEECKTNGRSFRKSPAPEYIAPQEGQNEKVAPDHELEIVPLPWRGFEKITYAKNYNSGQDKRYVSWWSITPTPAGFPNTPADQPHEHHRQGNPQAEVWQPKLKKRRDDAVPRFLQKRTKRRRRSKIR